MNRKERWTIRIVHELAGMSIAELREFGRTAVKLVIEKKQEKQHYINA